MTEFAWCRPLLRILGVLLIALSLPTAIDYTARLVQSSIEYRSASWMLGGDRLFWFLMYCVGAYVQLFIGLYLLFGGRRVLRWVLRGVDTCCIRCGYELVGVAGDRCPECGLEQPMPDRKVFPKSRNGSSGEEAASGG